MCVVGVVGGGGDCSMFENGLVNVGDSVELGGVVCHHTLRGTAVIHSLQVLPSQGSSSSTSAQRGGAPPKNKPEYVTNRGTDTSP